VPYTLHKILRRGGNFGQPQTLLVVEAHNVREGAANVDSDVEHAVGLSWQNW
jgi:hypothetical protein